MDSTPLILIERHKKGKAYKVIKLLNDLNPSYSLPLRTVRPNPRALLLKNHGAV